MTQILFTAGGTGGHIYPAIAVASQFKTADCFFIGSIDREDARIVPKYGYEFIPITKNTKHPLALICAIWKCIRLIKKRNISLCFSTGGYTTLPVVIAAWFCRKKIILHEQNAIPGRSNRLLSHFATMLCLTYPESAKYFKKKNIQITGNPVREISSKHPETQYIQKLPFERPPILIFGGSLGAKGINDFILKHLDRISIYAPVIWVTGHVWNAAARLPKNCEFDSHLNGNIITKNGQVRAVIMPYFEDLVSLYPLAKLVICRAGATTLAEVTRHNKKAILIPYPYAKDNHQQANANAHVSRYPSKIIKQSELEIESFMTALESLDAQLFSQDNTQKMAKASVEIAKIIETLNYQNI